MSGEGEGSKATLVAWLKRRAEADFGHGVVGRNVWVCWCDPQGCCRVNPTHKITCTGCINLLIKRSFSEASSRGQCVRLDTASAAAEHFLLCFCSPAHVPQILLVGDAS